MIMRDNECFEILDSANFSYRSKLKEPKHIILEKTVAEQTGKARKYFNNYQSANFLFYFDYCYCKHVALIIFWRLLFDLLVEFVTIVIIWAFEILNCKWFMVLEKRMFYKHILQIKVNMSVYIASCIYRFCWQYALMLVRKTWSSVKSVKLVLGQLPLRKIAPQPQN